MQTIMSVDIASALPSLVDPPLGWSSGRGSDVVRLSFAARHEVQGGLRRFSVEFGVVNRATESERAVVDKVRADGSAEPPCHGWVRAGLWGMEPREAVVHLPVAIIRRAGTARQDFGTAWLSASGTEGDIETEQAAPASGLCRCRFRWQLRFELAGGAGLDVRELGRAVTVTGSIEVDGQRYTAEPDTSLGIIERRRMRLLPVPMIRLATRNLASRKARPPGWLSVAHEGGRSRLVVQVAQGRQVQQFGGTPFWRPGMVSVAATDQAQCINWKLVGKSLTGLVEVEVHCPKIEMLRRRPQQPDGSYRHTALWSGGTGLGEARLYAREGETLELIDTITLRDVLCEYGVPAPRF